MYDREDSENQFIFVRGRQLDPLGGEKSTAAVQISWCLRKFVDAGATSDVLDFPLSCSSRPPTEEPAGSEDSD